VSVNQIIDMIAVPDCGVSAARAVGMTGMRVCIAASHADVLLYSFLQLFE